jgi:hypothetical protein
LWLGSTGSVSTFACSECMRVDVGEVPSAASPAGAGFETLSVSVSAAEVVSMEEAVAAV